MSAFIVEKVHVDCLIEAGLRGPGALHFGDDRRLTIANHDVVGQLLVDALVASVAHRYPQDAVGDLPGPSSAYWLEAYVYDRPLSGLSPLETLKACRCFAYQASEVLTWEGSDAKAFVDALSADATSRLDGYDDAPWEITGAWLLAKAVTA